MIPWLLTFALHSTIWCTAACLLLKLRPAARPRTRETIWQIAIAASLITPTAQTVALPINAFWNIPFPAVAAESFEHADSSAEHTAPALSVLFPHAPASEHAPATPWSTILITAWVAATALLIVLHAARTAAFRRRISPRDPVDDQALRSLHAQLVSQARLRRAPALTECDHLPSPIVLAAGLSSEICLPTRARHELDRDQLTAMLAHELAHIERADPARLFLLNLLQSIFFFQPMLRLAVREIRRAAEEQCDDRAASRTEDALAMASCLATVAAWVRDHNRPLPALGMAANRSQLANRVNRLLINRASRADRVPRIVIALLACCALTSAPWLAPAIAFTSEPAAQHEHNHNREHSSDHAEHLR